ncbi:MAG: exodeoxyribonuclease III [Alphaproteobacteria bacterium]|nr:exodeoxyribonuclease III [Alphaproteobacteria bacterium]
MKIATWNVNSVKARSAHLTRWLGAFKPDIVMLQEIKCQTEDFPVLDIKALGYNAVAVGQKAYNGVALLSTKPIDVVLTRLPGDEGDVQARYIEADIDGVRVASIYLPNGNPSGTEKFTYKLGWMDRLAARAAELLATEKPVVLAGDYNICPTDIDCYSPEAFVDDALCRPESRGRFRALVNSGYTDALRALHPTEHLYTYWDYQAGAWQRDLGLRIDHLLLSPQAADRLVDAGVDKKPRGEEKASDHTPAWVELS